MVQAYNFLGSWQLFPEKGAYESGERPKSGIYKIESPEGRRELVISHSWVTLANEAFTAQYAVSADGDRHPFPDPAFADEAEVLFHDSISFTLRFYRGNAVILEIAHEIQPNGYLRITVSGTDASGKNFTDVEVFHRQMSVLPYSTSVSGAVVKANEEGVIRHKALTAMEEQTNMQLEQIRKQIELLALQAQEIHKRKELSMTIYNAKISFKPEIGQVYHLYEKADGTHLISLISPKEWGAGMPYKSCVAAVQLLADHTWKEL